jgi:hypothetical protein
MSAASHEAARRFFMASQYAVAGASQDTKKYGYKRMLSISSFIALELD